MQSPSQPTPLIERIQQLENLTDTGRRDLIKSWLKQDGIDYQTHNYSTGQNLIVPPQKTPFLAVTSHFDTVPGTPGANDNGSAIAVAYEIALRVQASPLQNLGVNICFFDEEEVGLKGSAAFIQDHELKGLLGILNMELVGMGNQFALWPLTPKSGGKLLDIYEAVSKHQQHPTTRIDRLVMNTADHATFREAGFDAFTISVISDEDLRVAAEYFQALNQGQPWHVLSEIFAKAPVMQHYHQPTDWSKHLSESALQMTVESIWETLCLYDDTL